MKLKTFKPIATVVAIFLAWESVALLFPLRSWANSEVLIQHTPPICTASHHPFPISAVIPLSKAFDEVRVYFKAQGASSYYFVAMRPEIDQTYIGVLPSATEAGMVIEYFIAMYQAGKQILRSPLFYTLTAHSSECPPAGIPKDSQPITVYADTPTPAEIGFAGDAVQWHTVSASGKPSTASVEETRETSQPNSEDRPTPQPEKSASILSAPRFTPKMLLGLGLGAGAATIAGFALSGKEEPSIDWTLDPGDLDDDILVEIIKAPQVQTVCGTLVNNYLYVTNERNEPFTISTIDYEVVLTDEKPEGGCEPGRLGTFAPNLAAVVAPGERVLVRQWSNTVNPCNGCPYMSSECEWASKYVVHTAIGSGEAETTFSTKGDLCATNAKSLNSCAPHNADVIP